MEWSNACSLLTINFYFDEKIVWSGTLFVHNSLRTVHLPLLLLAMRHNITANWTLTVNDGKCFDLLIRWIWTFASKPCRARRGGTTCQYSKSGTKFRTPRWLDKCSIPSAWQLVNFQIGLLIGSQKFNFSAKCSLVQLFLKNIHFSGTCLKVASISRKIWKAHTKSILRIPFTVDLRLLYLSIEKHMSATFKKIPPPPLPRAASISLRSPPLQNFCAIHPHPNVLAHPAVT